MNKSQLSAIKLELTQRLDSLKNDFARAYIDIPGSPNIAVSPFPIVMYCMATLDLFSGLWAGWSDSKNRKSDTRSQTQRMVDFLTTFMGYPVNKSSIMIQMYRHKLMHTSEARQLLNSTTGEIYLMNISPSLKSSDYLAVIQKAKYKWLQFGVENFIDDLEDAIFGNGKYYDQLTTNETLQSNFITCWTELNSYTL